MAEPTEWILVGGRGETLRLDAGHLSGFSGCNRYVGGYTLDGDRLTVGPIATTRMACAPEAMEAEDAFLAALGATAGLVVSDEALALLDEGGRELCRFAPHVPEPSASTWSEREEPGWS
ncbi:MAG TPA: META domain-containing protein [Gaiellaceae bacterium]|jgi:heat shock protein HslJ|nr:META domain-containing protein [Gaiellaceae bacterium]